MNLLEWRVIGPSRRPALSVPHDRSATFTLQAAESFRFDVQPFTPESEYLNAWCIKRCVTPSASQPLPPVISRSLGSGCVTALACHINLHDVVRGSFPILAYDEAAATWHGKERARLKALQSAQAEVERLPEPFVGGQPRPILGRCSKYHFSSLSVSGAGRHEGPRVVGHGSCDEVQERDSAVRPDADREPAREHATVACLALSESLRLAQIGIVDLGVMFDLARPS
jgi:hypothetical protein